jgi:hypothetical protein
MFARSLISLNVAPALAAILAITAMPGIASAQERDMREQRAEAARATMGMGQPAGQPQVQRQAQPQFQAQRQVQVQPQVYQQQQPRVDYQQRGQGWGNRQPSGDGDRGQNWQSNRGFAQQQAQQQRQAQAGVAGWQNRGRDPSQLGGQDRERGDRPSWQSRNPTYTDGNRNPAYQPPVINQQARPTPPLQQNPGQTVDRANDRNDRNNRNDRNDGWRNGRGGQGQWNGERGENWNRGNQGQWSDNRGRNWNRGDQNRWSRNDQRRWQRGNNDWNRGGWGQGGWGNGYGNGWGNGGGFRRWDNGWRRDRRYDWFGWRNQNRGIFRGGFYNSPYNNFGYSQLSIGVVLGSLFYDQQYWINDPGYYHLPDAYGSYRWVRYYNDAVLVDTYTGEVVDVINNFYW